MDNYQCPICGIRFADMNGLDKHQVDCNPHIHSLFENHVGEYFCQQYNKGSAIWCIVGHIIGAPDCRSFDVRTLLRVDDPTHDIFYITKNDERISLSIYSNFNRITRIEAESMVK